MSYGFETRDPAGNVTYSTLDHTYTLLGTYVASANTSVTFNNVPIMPDRIVSRLMVGQVAGDDEAYIHTFTLVDGTLSATAPDSSNTVETFILVFGR